MHGWVPNSVGQAGFKSTILRLKQNTQCPIELPPYPGQAPCLTQSYLHPEGGNGYHLLTLQKGTPHYQDGVRGQVTL